MGNRLLKKNRQKGQSTIEFIMTFSMVFAFTFLFLKIAMNYTDGYMVHYATFMASRSYLTVDPKQQKYENVDNSDDDAAKYAKETFNKFLPEGLIKDFNGQVNVIDPAAAKFTPYIGLFTKYTTQFSLGVIGGTDELEMRSESFLGREPTRYEVYFQICNAIKTVTGATCDKQATLDDNGG
jgi:hypothetical protein